MLATLPAVKGTYTPTAPIARLTWFRVGGPAEILYKPADLADLQHFMAKKPADIPVTVIGVGSNMLVRDGGIAGVVIVLGKAFREMEVVDGTHIRAGAGAIGRTVSLYGLEHSLSGPEFLSGIPGTVGGAVAMNAGAYGGEVSDILINAEVVMSDGELRTLPAKSLSLSYRHCTLPKGAIVTAATFRCQPADKEAIRQRIDDIAKAREESQPLRTRTGGSTFKNPPGHKAWQLVDEAGCRGFTVGGAQMSEKHCNFMINTGDATAADIENLGEEVRRRVKEKTGVELEWEIKRMGRS